MRVRELGPKSLEEAEQIAVRIEGFKFADKQRLRLVVRLDSEVEQGKEDSGKALDQFELLSDAISTLTNEVKHFGQQNSKNTNKGRFYNQRTQKNNQNYNRNRRFGRSYQNNQNYSSNNGQRRSAERYRGDNSAQAYPVANNSQLPRRTQHDENSGFTPRKATNSGNNTNAKFPSSRQGNSNQSAWGPQTDIIRWAQKGCTQKYGRRLFCACHSSYLSRRYRFKRPHFM